jgi:hypothetical protein
VKKPPTAQQLTSTETGYWIPYIYPRGKRFAGRPTWVDISLVRGMPTSVASMGTSDPFGPTTAQISVPSVTLLDSLGEGDLWWCTGDVNVDIHWFDVKKNRTTYTWEGHVTSFEWGGDGGTLTITCRGALLQLQDFLSVPKYPYQPSPYEIEIANQFKNRPSLRLAGMQIQFPKWWTKTYDKVYWDKQPLYRRPTGLVKGQKWTGLMTRNTGEFGASIEHIEELLGAMFTERGQWTLMLGKGRVPILSHRDRLDEPVVGITNVVDLLHPGVHMTSATRDHGQKVSAVYANGTTVKGVTFNGMRVSPNGANTWYEPYAARREVEPAITTNPWYDSGVLRREVNIQFSEGADEEEAYPVAQQHLDRYVDSGVTATMELTIDPMVPQLEGAAPIYKPRQLLMAGESIQVKNIFGRPEGMLFHITEVSTTDEATSLTLDSKYRDQLTVQEVRAGSRDALAPVRMLAINSYAPTMQDLLFPWSYTLGSGAIPRQSKNFLKSAPASLEFPWDAWTKAHPPRDKRYTNAYIKIGPTSKIATNNWAKQKTANAKDFKAYTVRLSQAGEARLLQIAAYDRNGAVMKVPFHVSFYMQLGIKASNMPKLTTAQAKKYPPYKANQNYPFFAGAFESVDSNGRLNESWQNSLGTAGLIAGWGNYYDKAGYWPGTSTSGSADTATGMLSLTMPGLSWNLVGGDAQRVDQQRTPAQNLANDTKGVADVAVMIYCDAQKTKDVFFLGRIYRLEQTGR